MVLAPSSSTSPWRRRVTTLSFVNGFLLSCFKTSSTGIGGGRSARCNLYTRVPIDVYPLLDSMPDFSNRCTIRMIDLRVRPVLAATQLYECSKPPPSSPAPSAYIIATSFSWPISPQSMTAPSALLLMILPLADDLGTTPRIDLASRCYDSCTIDVDCSGANLFSKEIIKLPINVLWAVAAAVFMPNLASRAGERTAHSTLRGRRNQRYNRCAAPAFAASGCQSRHDDSTTGRSTCQDTNLRYV